MENYNVYEDIASRTNGDIYVGVVGPVRTGKSTFIKRFMEKLVVPFANGADKMMMTDELPQSASGKTVMTTEPKFVPAKAAKITVSDKTEASVRLVDCVGFAVKGAIGFEEDGVPRSIKTPWSETPLPFEEAAAIGTEKVIKDHSTIGVLVTTDGSVTDIPRENYIEAEERCVAALRAIDKPFVILLNCKNPQEQEGLRAELELKYGATVVAVNVEKMDEREIVNVLQRALFEFPVLRIDVKIPKWIRALPEENETVACLLKTLKSAASNIRKMKDCFALETLFEDGDFLPPCGIRFDLGKGIAEIEMQAKESLFYKVLSAEAGEVLGDELALIRCVKKYAVAYKNYEKIQDAFLAAQETGYGVAQPRTEDLSLEKPCVVKKGASYGVKFKAKAASYHVIRVNVSGEVQPIIGTKSQSEDFIGETLKTYETDEEKVWETNIFGKDLKELLGDELAKKTRAVPTEIGKKVTRVLTRVVNDGKGGVLCILI
jgi:stage IV sporulation protein A